MDLTCYVKISYGKVFAARWPAIDSADRSGTTCRSVSGLPARPSEGALSGFCRIVKICDGDLTAFQYVVYLHPARVG